MSEQRISLVKDLLQSIINEYSDAKTRFTNLDTKAQSTTAIAGIFLAGALAFFNGDSLQKLITYGGRVTVFLLGIAVFLLMLSTIFCIWAMLIRDISIIENENLREEVEGILRQDSDELSDRYENYLRDQAEEWSKISKELLEVNQQKAKAVRRGQVSLSIAVI